MKSNRIVTFFKQPMTAVFAVCLFTGIANAQSATGRFTLPFEAKWGRAVLPPGDYSFSLDHESVPNILTVRNARRNVALLVPRGHDHLKPSKENSLILIRHGSQSVVRMLKLGSIGEAYSYPVPKGEKSTQMAQGPQLMQRVPVTVAGE